jgi:hypothetical protein
MAQPEGKKKTIGSIFGHDVRSLDTRTFKPSRDLVIPDCLVGIEIELERCGRLASNHGFNKVDPATGKEDIFLRTPSELWKLHADGSLRDDGMEFITLPVLGKDIQTALTELEQFFIDNGTEPQISERCSVHVHMNVHDLSLSELIYLICLYTVFESNLFNYVGKEREQNFYCLPYYNTDAFAETLNYLWTDAQNEDDGRVIDTCAHFEKYSALNIGALSKYGTLEFRHHPGTYSSRKLLEWVNVLLSLKKFCYGKVPTNFPEHFSAYNNRDFGREVFGYELYEKLSYNGMEPDLVRGVRVAQDILRWDNLRMNQSDHFLINHKEYEKELSKEFNRFSY